MDSQPDLTPRPRPTAATMQTPVAEHGKNEACRRASYALVTHSESTSFHFYFKELVSLAPINNLSSESPPGIPG